MSVSLIGQTRFRGWHLLNKGLRGLPAAEAVVSLGRVVAAIMTANDGTFPRVGNMNPTSHHMMQRLLLQRWAREDWRAPTAANAAHVPAMHPALMSAYRSLVGARSRHPSLGHNLRRPTWERVVSSVWVSSLEQEFANRAPKQELARAWIFFDTIWPRLLAAGTVNVPAPCATAFASLDYALLLVAMLWHAQGHIPDLRAALQHTQLGPLATDTLLDCYTTPAEAFVANDTPSAYPVSGWANPFARAPILRVGDARLICPDPSVLFAGVEFRILQEALGGDFVATSRAFGKVFEAYVLDVLNAIPAPVLGGQVSPEFPYQRNGQQVDTPDAFVIGVRNVVFEVKALRYPYDADAAANVEGFVSWLSKLAGANDERGPLEQGANFFADVEAGIVPRFPPGSMRDALYLMVSYQDIPFGIANCLQLRAKYWSTLGPAAKLSSPRSAFVSIRDLETAATIAEAAHRAGTPFSFSDEAHEWWAYCSRHRLPPSLRDYLLVKHPGGAGHSLSLHEQANIAFFARAEAAAFGPPP